MDGLARGGAALGLTLVPFISLRSMGGPAR